MPILRTLAIPITIPTVDPDMDMDTAPIHMGMPGVGATHSSAGTGTGIRITAMGTPITDTEGIGMVIGDTVTAEAMGIEAAMEATAIAAATPPAHGDSRVAVFVAQQAVFTGRPAVFTAVAGTVDHRHLNFAPKT